MALILNIETSTTLCSVALASEGRVLALKEVNEGYTHAEHLHVFINDVLNQAGVKALRLNAVAVGAGPGSYTGLRIGASAAKGLAYGLGIPLISEHTLKIMANAVVSTGAEDVYYCPMLDARRMEVYCAVYDKGLKEIKPTSAEIIEGSALDYFTLDKPLVFFGDGMPKCKAELSVLRGAGFMEGIVPSAASLAQLSYLKYKAGQFEDVAYFEPFYLKDFLITVKK
ncbi:MAG: tRNA (adenosine(37)-N6)-threonylcarbamoyltransferase complex dimerization subunit type 1 TsaB [Bacteroidia bacterium]